MLFVVHKGTGTIIAAEECVLVHMHPLLIDAQGGLDAVDVSKIPGGEQVVDPSTVIHLGETALREHVEGYARETWVEGFDESDFRAVAEYMLDDPAIWDVFSDAFDRAVEQVQEDKTAE